MLVHLNKADQSAASAKTVGGKAASLARLYKIPALRNHAPKSYALSTAFFKPWLDILTTSREFVECQQDGISPASLEAACSQLKQKCATIALNSDQEIVLKDMSTKIEQEFNKGLASVRSSAVEEDGGEHSFAGIFETKLGVRSDNLETAVRECFASKFDARVLQYTKPKQSGVANDEVGFAVVVMEMVDSVVAGVAFSANPLNSDRDECVVDSSWGLGESVVDGSVTADRFIFDKVNKELVHQEIGEKPTEKRLDVINGQVKSVEVDKDRSDSCSLPSNSLHELVELVVCVEQEYGKPMDVEWAITEDGVLILLQARPITTLFWLDENMMTGPGEKRILYYDFNIASEATTTRPFCYMDFTMYNLMIDKMFELPPGAHWISNDPKMPVFNGSTRQYVNLSIFFKYLTPAYFAKESSFLDPYLESLYKSKDCSRSKYRMKKIPKEVNIRNGLWYIRKLPLRRWYKTSRVSKKNPENAKLRYLEVLEKDLVKLKAVEERGCNEEGLVQYAFDLVQSMEQSLTEEMGIIFAGILGLSQKMDRKRQLGKTEEERLEYEALCGGYEGDPLMEINIDMYHLANKLGPDVWDQYGFDKLPALAERIQKNIDGVVSDLPIDFLSEYDKFMEKHGWDGEDQLFISSPRYQDDTVLLLARLRQNAGSNVKDPSIRLDQNVKARKRVQELQAERAKSKCLHIGYSKIQHRNEVLNHLMWVRNAPKLRLSRICGVLRKAVLKIEADLVKKKRLDATGDIFYLGPIEVDAAVKDPSIDLMTIVRPRKVIFERALKATECPMLIDSRCRILRPDPPESGNLEPGILLGVAVSPGVATGRVRILHSPTDRFEEGEVLVTTVTSPAWTPLFISASGIVLQVGGVLQHGALCAREYGKPAVSNIDVYNLLESGMLVTVDGNKGTVTIIEEN